MDAVIMLDTTSPATVLGSIKDTLEHQLKNVSNQQDWASLNRITRMISALHTMFSTQQPHSLYTSLQEFIEVTTCYKSSVFNPHRFNLPEDQQATKMMSVCMNTLLKESFQNIYHLANTCTNSLNSASSLDKTNSYETHPDKKDEEEDIKFGDFYDYVVDEEEDGTHVRFIFNKEKYDKYWTQFKAKEKKYGFDKAKFIIRGL